MSMMRECIQLLSSGISVTFNPFITLTDTQMSGLQGGNHNHPHVQPDICDKICERYHFQMHMHQRHIFHVHRKNGRWFIAES